MWLARRVGHRIGGHGGGQAGRVAAPVGKVVGKEVGKVAGKVAARWRERRSLSTVAGEVAGTAAGKVENKVGGSWRRQAMRWAAKRERQQSMRIASGGTEAGRATGKAGGRATARGEVGATGRMLLRTRRPGRGGGRRRGGQARLGDPQGDTSYGDANGGAEIHIEMIHPAHDVPGLGSGSASPPNASTPRTRSQAA